MVVEIINIKKCLVISDAIRKIAMRTGAIRTSNVHSVDAITALSLVHFYVRSRDQFAKLGGNASFYTYINQIFDDKCELVSKICSRRKVRRVQTYSLRNRLNLSLISQIERLQNLFAKFKTLCTFVSANVAISNKIRYILNRITRAYSPAQAGRTVSERLRQRANINRPSKQIGVKAPKGRPGKVGSTPTRPSISKIKKNDSGL